MLNALMPIHLYYIFIVCAKECRFRDCYASPFVWSAYLIRVTLHHGINDGEQMQQYYDACILKYCETADAAGMPNDSCFHMKTLKASQMKHTTDCL